MAEQEGRMKRILSPLDGTADAEHVLPLLGALAHGGADVRLVYVAPKPGNVIGADGHTVAYADQERARLQALGAAYLESVQLRLGAPVGAAVRFGDPATEILAEAECFGADTIVVATATPSRVKRALRGSVAGAIARRARAAVLFYRPARGV
jgi:nucleotide-binding universal stress UspA family protein